MQGAEERRLRRMEQYAVEREERSKATPLELCEIPSRRGDDALMVDQGEVGFIDNPLGIVYLSEYQQHI